MENGGAGKHFLLITTFCNTEFSFAKERKTLVKIHTFLLIFLSVSLVQISRKQTAVWLLSQWQVCRGEGLSSEGSDFMHVSHYDTVPCRVCVEIPLQHLSGFSEAFYFFSAFFWIKNYISPPIVGNPSTGFL